MPERALTSINPLIEQLRQGGTGLSDAVVVEAIRLAYENEQRR